MDPATRDRVRVEVQLKRLAHLFPLALWEVMPTARPFLHSLSVPEFLRSLGTLEALVRASIRTHGLHLILVITRKMRRADFGSLLAAWGPCALCPEDLNGDGFVSGADLGSLLSVWGVCP